MTEHTNLLGIKISGDISRRDTYAPQRPQSELEPLIRALLDDPYIVEFGWRQYTPYFNDGDPCEFGARSLWVRTQDQMDDADEDFTDFWHLILEDGHPTLGKTRGWGENRRYEGTRESQFKMCDALDGAIQRGEFDNVLIELFGDHAQVTVRRDGIQVEYYSHD